MASPHIRYANSRLSTHAAHGIEHTICMGKYISHPDPLTYEYLCSVSHTSGTGCIEWQGARYDKVYGSICHRGRKHRIHRLAWELVHGSIPAGKYVCHRCDNPPCFNIAHLFLGTPLDNNKDAWAKGRAYSPYQVGSAHLLSKLTDEDVIAIRAMWATRRFSKSEIARLFGVTQPQAKNVITRYSWSHLA